MMTIVLAPETDHQGCEAAEDHADGGLVRQQGSLARGCEVIRATLRTLPEAPGSYRMMDRHGDVLYVGKAKNLRKRVVAYTRVETLPLRLQRMVAQTDAMEVVTTRTEVEALLLEANLIKTLRPRYNILLKDDKSFPFLVIVGEHSYPRLIKHRGGKSVPGEYFGPFASGAAVNATLTILQRVFLLRSCSDAIFSSRTRPCLQYQIKRCSAPCVARISESDYATLIDQARAFLKGKSREIQRDLAQQMERCAEALEFEKAAVLRDRIRRLTHIQERQEVHLAGLGDADVIAVHQAGGQSCVQVFFYRAGQAYGSRAFFPAHGPDDRVGDVLEAFLEQFYVTHEPPDMVLVSEEPSNRNVLEMALKVRTGLREGRRARKVSLFVPRRGDRATAVANALLNAREALGRRLAETATQAKLLEGVAGVFGLAAPPGRIEVYDNSHIQGTNAVGAMIVAGAEGFIKAAYRTFTIRSADIMPGDDFGMMREVLTRRFAGGPRGDLEKAKEQWPDMVLIDGGKGQLKVAEEVFSDLGVTGVALVAIAKGEKRNDGRETYHRPGCEPVSFPANDPVHYFLERLRDEAHRFAIGTHRRKRLKAISLSVLDALPGIGPKRKRALLHRFGSVKGVAGAALVELESVEGISASLAQKIYERFHGKE